MLAFFLDKKKGTKSQQVLHETRKQFIAIETIN